MPEKAGLQIGADLKSLKQELQNAVGEFRKFNADVLGTVKSIHTVEEASKKGGKALSEMGFAGRALSSALGFLGATSIQTVVTKFANLGKEAVRMAINLQAVEDRAKALFGSAFPQMQARAEELAKTFKRSASDIMQMQTGFGLLLDSVGASARQTREYSAELSKLTVVLGKARPDLKDAEIYGKIEAGILGNARGLRELGIAMSSKALQDFTDRKNRKLKLEEMTDEQLMMTRTEFLLEETTKLQEAAAASQGKLGDSLKETSASWHDLLESVGQDISPWFQAGNSAMLDMLSDWVRWIGMVKGAWIDMVKIVGLSTIGFSPAKMAGMLNGKESTTPLLTGSISSTSNRPEGDESDFWTRRAGGGGGGGNGKTTAEKLIDQERKILQALSAQAKVNEEKLRDEREELILRREMGILTKDEERRLQTINRRTEFQNDAIQDATDEWRKQAEAIEQVDEKIKDLNERIADERDKLKQTLADIDKDFARKTAEEAADLIREQNKIREQGSGAAGLTPEQSYKLGEIASQLNQFSEQDILEGQRLAGLSDKQLLDEEKERRKQEAKEESDARVQSLQNELTMQEQTKANLQTVEDEKRKIVIDALAKLAEDRAPFLKLLEQQTIDSVNKEIAAYNQLAAAISRSRGGQRSGAIPIQRAMGGPVSGTGGPTDDKIAAWLSNGEYVINAAATKLYRPIIERINAMTLPAPRFAAGGMVSNVSNSSDRTAHITVNNYGNAARVHADPLLMKWRARTMLG